MAERYIRTLMSFIFGYLHERDTDGYIDELEKFVSIINRRINRLIKLAPIPVSQKDAPHLVTLCNSVPPQQPNFNVGDRVRIRRKIETFHVATEYNSLKSFPQFHTDRQKIPQHMSSKM